MTSESITINNVGEPLLEALEKALNTTGAKLTRFPMSVTTLEPGKEPVTCSTLDVLAGRIEMTANVIGWVWWSETRMLTITVLKASFGAGIIHQLCRSKIDALRALVFDPRCPVATKDIKDTAD